MENRLFSAEVASANLCYNDLNIRLVAIDYDRKQAIWYTPDHTHDYYEFYLLTGGRQYTIVEGVQFTTSAGEYIIVPPNVEHGHRQIGTVQDFGILVRFYLSKLPGVQPGAGTADRVIAALCIPRHHAFPGEDIADIFSDVPEGADLDQLSLRMVDFVLRLAKKLRADPELKSRRVSFHRSSEDNDALVRRVIMTILTSYMTNLNLDALADYHGISKRNLSRQFSRVTGFTVMRFVALERMRQALRLLREQDLSIREIAFRVGFRNEFYFSNSFSRLFGAPPSACRDARLPLPEELSRFESFRNSFERHVSPRPDRDAPPQAPDVPGRRFIQYISGNAVNMIQESAE